MRTMAGRRGVRMRSRPAVAWMCMMLFLCLIARCQGQYLRRGGTGSSFVPQWGPSGSTSRGEGEPSKEQQQHQWRQDEALISEGGGKGGGGPVPQQDKVIVSAEAPRPGSKAAPRWGSTSSGERQAYVTVVTTAKYVIGAEVVAKCLRAFGATRPMVALVDTSIIKGTKASERLRGEGWEVRPIPPLANPNAERVRDRPWFETTFSKLHVFGMQDYDKVIYLDADLLITQNIDLLFDVDVSSDPDIPFAAASEVLPPDTFNSGVMVVTPSASTFKRLQEAAGHIESYDGSDQGFLNRFFSGWWNAGPSHRLPFAYNVPQTFAMYHPAEWEKARSGGGVAILHFAGDASMKPWSFAGVVPPSLAEYIFLWQEIARTAPMTNVRGFIEGVVGLGEEAAYDASRVAKLFS